MQKLDIRAAAATAIVLTAAGIALLSCYPFPTNSAAVLSPPHDDDSWRGGGEDKNGSATFPIEASSWWHMLPHLGSAIAADVPTSTAPHGDDFGTQTRLGQTCRNEYKPSDYLVDWIILHFDLHEENTQVSSRLMLRRRPGTVDSDLVLDGEDLKLISIRVNNVEAIEDAKSGYTHLGNGSLRLSKAMLPEASDTLFELTIVVSISPNANLGLMGLYMSNGIFVTQCEPEGFRRITYFFDRPDIMTRYSVRLTADAEKFPVLLSNGNKVEAGVVKSDPKRHFAVFHDPFPKPSYLFAVVAGNLSSKRSNFITKSGRVVDIEVHSEEADAEKLDWAIHSVKTSMKWDEDTFGREYDLDTFHIVCVKDFNPGAMENKGLNIFNCNILLADPKTTTDTEYERILAVVAHEYFHNWTGNRITCRDWFQLTLKEGLTVFREQLFCGEVGGSASVRRIEDVSEMISRQFIEDSGPFAHAIRPESYISVDNFYTSTVYNKGAEVIRMYYTILGAEGFRKGMDLYFQRHDGQAATCDDFRSAMADSSGKNFDQFERWYLQAGTPEVEVKARYYPEEQQFIIHLKQYTHPTPGQPIKLPQVIPVRLGLIGKHSKRDLLGRPDTILELTEEEQTFTLSDVKEDCVPSILRDFSAPVKLHHQQSPEDFALLMAYDTDPVNKWSAGQTFTLSIIVERAHAAATNPNVIFKPLPAIYIDALRDALRQEGEDNSVKALMLRPPRWTTLVREFKPTDPDALHRARKSVILDITSALKSEMVELYSQLSRSAGTEEIFEWQDVGRRRLRNVLLLFLSEPGDREAAERAYKHFSDALCMTNKYSGLVALGSMQQPEREWAFERFYNEANGDALVVDKWFRAQAVSDLPDALERIIQLQEHPKFSFTNPNRMRSLLFSFASENTVHFHRPDGKGYRLISDTILKVDKFNPVVASSGARLLMTWRDFTSERQILMKKELERIWADATLSVNVREIVSKALNQSSDAAA